MNKIIIPVLAIALVAVIMGMSVVAPMIPPAFAHDVGPEASEKAHKICDLNVLPPEAEAIICDPHGTGCPPSCNGVNVESIIF